MKTHCLYRNPKWDYPRLVLKTTEEWGIVTADLCRPPQRLLAIDQHREAPVENGMDSKRLVPDPSPVETLAAIDADANVSALGRRSIARLWSYFLVCEDPQRRFDAREVSTLAHQISLVRHVLDNDSLSRVLIADEVGLGKTVEAGLIIKELLEQRPSTKVLYFAPARLVSNVRKEFDRLGLSFRQWSSQQADARLDDPLVVASIHRAVHPAHRDTILAKDPWDVIVVDECHHLSDWAEGGGDPREKFRLVRDLIRKQSTSGRVIFLSGTPHQGHMSRFENLVGLLRGPDEPESAIEGRVIFRTKDDVVDWNGDRLFPRRTVNLPLVIDLGDRYRRWISAIHDHFCPPRVAKQGEPTAKQRAAGWRCAQAMQWAASSPQAGLGYLVRQAIRLGATPEDPTFAKAIRALRPYRHGPEDEAVDALFQRIQKEIQRQQVHSDVDDIEDDTVAVEREKLDDLYCLLADGLVIINECADLKWNFIKSRVIDPADEEKIVFFAQPIETVTAFVNFLKREYGEDISVIVGGQSDAERGAEVEKFLKPDGTRFLVSSKAGGEGINLQVARRLVHIDVPWNPMDMEQRVGRVHRFGSRRNIIVDTIVVKDSREEHAYRAAREKLRLIASTLVAADNFESLFSRVICLLPPEELQHLLIADDLGPLSEQNEQDLARMVREGYEKWREFDSRYAEQQRRIRAQDAGIAKWDDLREFMVSFGKASVEEGFAVERFELDGDSTKAVQTSSPVLRLSDNSLVACQDLGGLPAYGPNGQKAWQFGVNHPLAMNTLAKAAFEGEKVGPAFIRWNRDYEYFDDDANVAVLAFLRLTMRADENRGWQEHATALRLFSVNSEGDIRDLDSRQSRMFFTGLFHATIRSKVASGRESISNLPRIEQELAEQLRRPTPEEIHERKRHAVASIFVGIVEKS